MERCPLTPLEIHSSNATMRTSRDRRAAELRAATIYGAILLAIAIVLSPLLVNAL